MAWIAEVLPVLHRAYHSNPSGQLENGSQNHPSPSNRRNNDNISTNNDQSPANRESSSMDAYPLIGSHRLGNLHRRSIWLQKRNPPEMTNNLFDAHRFDAHYSSYAKKRDDGYCSDSSDESSSDSESQDSLNIDIELAMPEMSGEIDNKPEHSPFDLNESEDEILYMPSFIRINTVNNTLYIYGKQHESSDEGMGEESHGGSTLCTYNNPQYLTPNEWKLAKDWVINHKIHKINLCDIIIDENAIDFLRDINRLSIQTLKIENSRFGHDFSTNMERNTYIRTVLDCIQSNENLTCLDIRNTPMITHSATTATEGRSVNNHESTLIPQNEAFQVLVAKHPTLQHIILHNIGLEDGSLFVDALLKRNFPLETLDLSYNSLPSNDVKSINWAASMDYANKFQALNVNNKETTRDAKSEKRVKALEMNRDSERRRKFRVMCNKFEFVSTGEYEPGHADEEKYDDSIALSDHSSDNNLELTDGVICTTRALVFKI